MSGTLRWTCDCGGVECAFPAKQATSIKCYCRYCRHFAMDMNKPHSLDAAGGVGIVHVQPDQIEFVRGHENLHVTHYSRKGARRFFAGCCDTPFASVPRSPKFPYAGLTANWVAPKESIGPPKYIAFPSSALASVTDRPGIPWLTFAKWTTRAIWSRISGSFRNSPFYDRDGALKSPVVERAPVPKPE